MPNDTTIVLRKARLRNKMVVILSFNCERKWIDEVKKLAGSRWSRTMGYGYLFGEQFDCRAFFEGLKRSGIHWKASFAAQHNRCCCSPANGGITTPKI